MPTMQSGCCVVTKGWRPVANKKSDQRQSDMVECWACKGMNVMRGRKEQEEAERAARVKGYSDGMADGAKAARDEILKVLGVADLVERVRREIEDESD
jgi:hypothetical protein